ncbi:MAG TPA: DUF6020 family protein [Candidatus Limiplasma sp.]|nr:DUF6020 family protein [Candidatus Limiplasma sp.]
MTRTKRTLPFQLAAALLIGAGCAVYAPFAPFTLGWLTALKLLLWGAAGFVCTFGLRDKLHKRLLRYTVPLSFLLALTFVVGAQMQVYGVLAFRWLNLLRLGGLWMLCFVLLCHLYGNVPVWLKPKTLRAPLNAAALLWVFFLGFCAFACLWLLSSYPILTNYDIAAHMQQITSGTYETHHALVYTLLIQGLLRLADCLGYTATWSFLMLGLLQMTGMGLSLGYGLVTLNRAGARRGAVIAAAVYLAVFPLFGYFAFSTTKDTFFACFLLLTAIELYRLSRSPASVWGMVRMAVFGVLMCQFRYNGIASLLLLSAGSVVYLIVRLIRRKRITPLLKRLVILFPVILLLNTGTSALLMRATGAVTPETVKRDVLSLPLQQLARVLTVTDDEADQARIEGLFGVDDIRERYYPYIADPVKAAFLYPDENYRTALRAWLKLGIKYPAVYLEALLENTRGAWFIDDLSHTQMDYWTDAYGYLEIDQEYNDAAYPIAYQSFLPGLQAWYKRVFNDNQYLNIPLVRYLFALAVQTWITILALGFAAYHRRLHASLLAVFALCVMLPLLLLPCMISRYFLPLFMLNALCLPALTTHKEKLTA